MGRAFDNAAMLLVFYADEAFMFHVFLFIKAPSLIPTISSTWSPTESSIPTHSSDPIWTCLELPCKGNIPRWKDIFDYTVEYFMKGMTRLVATIADKGTERRGGRSGGS